jgi:hypothetical protein
VDVIKNHSDIVIGRNEASVQGRLGYCALLLHPTSQLAALLSKCCKEMTRIQKLTRALARYTAS